MWSSLKISKNKTVLIVSILLILSPTAVFYINKGLTPYDGPDQSLFEDTTSTQIEDALSRINQIDDQLPTGSILYTSSNGTSLDINAYQLNRLNFEVSLI